MKFQLTFKTPDVLTELDGDFGYDKNTVEEAKAFAEKFLEYGEYITVAFDTELGTCVGVER